MEEELIGLTEYLENLPKDIKEKILKYSSDKYIEETHVYKDAPLISILSGLFIWDNTDEGHDYWKTIAKNYN